MPNTQKNDDPSDKVEQLGQKAHETVKKVYSYASGLPNDTIAYIFLIVGLFIFFLSPIFGGAIIGVVVGLCFSEPITEAIKAARGYFAQEQLGRTIVFLSLLVVLFYALPTLILGIIAAVGVSTLVGTGGSKGRKAK